MALARQGRGDDAFACLDLLNPVKHALDRQAAERYRVEPYVVAADVYGEGERMGRGGWTWYTGSAGWLYRAAVEGVLGIRKEGGRLFVDPALPAAWDGYSATLVLDGRKLSIRVDRGDGGGWQATVNGTVIKSSNEGYLL